MKMLWTPFANALTSLVFITTPALADHTEVPVLGKESLIALCEVAETRKQKGACILQSLFAVTAGLDVPKYDLGILELMTPSKIWDSSNPILESDRCRRAIKLVQKNHYAVATYTFPAFSHSHKRDQLYDVAITCNSIFFLQDKFLGKTLRLKTCTQEMNDTKDFAACISETMELYSEANLQAMQQHFAGVMGRLGRETNMFADRFDHDITAKIKSTFESDLTFCMRHATSGDGPQYKLRTAEMLLDLTFSQLTQPMSGSDFLARVRCEHVITLNNSMFGTFNFADAQAYLDARNRREALACGPERSANPPTEKEIASALNRLLTRTCTSSGMLAQWIENNDGSRQAGTALVGIAAMQFAAEDNACVMKSQITTSFTQPEMRFQVLTAKMYGAQKVSNGVYDLTVGSRLLCRTNDTRRLADDLFCSPFNATTANLKTTARWSREQCRWDVERVVAIE